MNYQTIQENNKIELYFEFSLFQQVQTHISAPAIYCQGGVSGPQCIFVFIPVCVYSLGTSINKIDNSKSRLLSYYILCNVQQKHF